MSKQEKHFYEFGPFRLDPVKRRLMHNGEPLPLAPKAFDTLLALVQQSGKTIEKDDLMRIVWPDAVVEENNLNQNISALRRALGDSRDESRYIATIPGLGYRFVAEVNEVSFADPETTVAERRGLRLVLTQAVEQEEDAPAEPQGLRPSPGEDVVRVVEAAAPIGSFGTASPLLPPTAATGESVIARLGRHKRTVALVVAL